MTLNEIKNLTRFLTDDEVENIKQQIKDKEVLLKQEIMDEEELGQVLNTLFAILVIEKSLENEIEGIEDIRKELEEELRLSYEYYDAHIAKYKRDEKKKKKRWFLDFLFLSDNIRNQKKGIRESDKTIKLLKNELEAMKQMTSDSYLKEALADRSGEKYCKFCDKPHKCDNPHHHKSHGLRQLRDDARMDKFVRDVMRGAITREITSKVRPPKAKEPRKGQINITVKTYDIGSSGQNQR